MRTVAHRAFLLGLFLAASACEHVEVDRSASARMRAASAQSLGEASGGKPDSAVVIGIVLGARIVGGGRAIAVLDAVPPHVKVLDREGRLRSAFLTRGGGPNETRFPSSLAASGDTAVLVSDISGRVRLFRLDGALLSESRVQGLAILSAVEACSGRWIVYGPRQERDGRIGWLHELRLAGRDSLVVQGVYADSARSRLLPVGVTYGLVSNGQDLLARHGFGAYSRLLSFRCGTSRAGSVALDGYATVPDDEPTPRGKGLFSFGHRKDDDAVAGLAITRTGPLLADIRWDTGEGKGATELALLAQRPRKILVEGKYHIRDSRRGDILFSTNDPVPHVFVVSEAEVTALFP
jgi:hypothetical protein